MGYTTIIFDYMALLYQLNLKKQVSGILLHCYYMDWNRNGWVCILSIPYVKAEPQWGHSRPCSLMHPRLLRVHLCSPNINPRTCTFPRAVHLDPAEDNKGWTNSKHTNILICICTETWWQRWTSSSPDRGIRSAAEREEEQPQWWPSSSPNRHTRSAAERERTDCR